jgi:hypothetical protein
MRKPMSARKLGVLRKLGGLRKVAFLRKVTFLRKPGLWLLVTFAISTLIPLGAGDLSTQIVRVSETKTLDAGSNGTIHLENSRGAVTIEGWDQPRVEITVIKSTRGLFRVSDPAQRDSATHLLDRIRIQSERSGNEILISAQIPPSERRNLNREMLVEYEIRAPRDSKIVVDRGNGGVYVAGMTGDIRATMQQGQITLLLPENAEYRIDARAKAGEVYSDFDGQEQRHHLLGHSFVTDHSVATSPSSTGGPPAAAHRLYLRVGFGDIAIIKVHTQPAP